MIFKQWLFKQVLGEGVFNFGKFKGKHHSEVPRPYLQWALQNINDPKFMDDNFRHEIEQYLGNRVASKPTATPSKSVSPVAAQSRNWVFAKVVGQNNQNLQPNDHVAMSRRTDGNWDFVTLDGKERTGTLAGSEISKIVQSVKDADNKPIQSPDYSSWVTRPEKKPQSRTLAPEQMSDEQKSIDQQFEQNLRSEGQNHLMISAKAGTGKTTMLKHLAWKYGNPRQKWLYLVFNTKNKVEGKQKFPPWVEVATTNGFLGNLLESPANRNKIKQTERTVKMIGGDEGPKLEKARLIVDGKDFTSLMKSMKIPGKEAASKINAGDSDMRTLQSLLQAIQYSFKEVVLKLLGLVKSFNGDPRNKPALEKIINKIYESYDIETGLDDVKERISKYDGYFAERAVANLKSALGYDFMGKDYKEEITKATIWMLEQTMPHASQQMHKKGQTDYKLGQFRDFNDDLWFASAHAEELSWPKYDIVLADEVQDFNENQKVVLKKLHDAGAKVMVAVGDARQSLYRFRGADGQAFDNIAKQMTDLSNNKKNVVHSLSTNYRSCPDILDYVHNRTGIKINAGKKSKNDGNCVVTDQEMHYDDSFDQLKREKSANKIKNTAYISRTNEPLVHAALKLLGNGIPFIIVGKDIAKDLLKHVDKVMRMTRVGDADDVQELYQKLDEFHQKETDFHGGSSAKKGYLQELGDTTKALIASIENFSPIQNDRYNEYESKTVGQFKEWLKKNLNGYNVDENERDLATFNQKVEKENPVILTTSHRSKGLEFERVFILRDDLFPHPRAKRPEDLEQEANSQYVAYTRAMDELHVLQLDGQPGYVPKNKE